MTLDSVLARLGNRSGDLGERAGLRRHRMYPLLTALARLKPHAFFVQIGGTPDPRRNPLQHIVPRSQWHGVVVDPIPAVAEQFHRTYAETGRVSIEQAAITSTDGERRFYFDPPEDSSTSSATGALRREVLYFARHYHADLDDRVAEIVTPGFTFESLCRRHGIEIIDVIRIDTAGDEAEILGQLDLSRVRPVLIAYNHALLGWGVRQSCAQRLRAFGYDTLQDGDDTWCLHTRGLPVRHALELRSIWRWLRVTGTAGRNGSRSKLLHRTARAVRGSRANGSGLTFPFPVSRDERRYLEIHYDDRTPLPPGAGTYLSRDNPRLRELQRRYEALDFLALRHHLWAADRVAGNVNLRYFRGDNLYVWHYAEHPRAMALKLFLYKRHLEERGGGRLLDALSEDGAFGCWTTEVAGYGKISRDLLDSVNEILFLDRHLGVLTKSRLRILDIGAGYGRLGHRLAAAASDLVDYCCVDAVADSTFLADYYLSFRDCTPPARALPLDEVPTLEPGAFDLAVNVHSFSECTIEAIRWWVDQLRRLRVPGLFIVPNEADGIVSRELDGSYHSVLPVLEGAGYVPIVKERAISDRATREALMLNDNFYLFTLADDASAPPTSPHGPNR